MTKAVVIGLILLILSIIVIAMSVEATTYCMDHDGGDNSYSGVFGFGADGLDSAWFTLQWAMSLACGIDDGDTCLIDADIYTEDGWHDSTTAYGWSVGVVCSVKGSGWGDNEKIVYKGYRGRPVFDGEDTMCVPYFRHYQDYQYGIFFLNDQFYIELDSLHIKCIGNGPPDWADEVGPEMTGFYSRGGDYLRFLRCKAESIWVGGDPPSGNHAGGFSFNECQEILCYECTSRVVYEKECDQNQACFDVAPGISGGGKNVIIRKCHGEYSSGGVDIKSYETPHTVVESCTFYQCVEGIRANSDSNTIAFNVLWGCRTGIYGYGGYGAIYGNKIYNNTVVLIIDKFVTPDWCNPLGRCGQGIGWDGPGVYVTDSIEIFNNIVVKEGAHQSEVDVAFLPLYAGEEGDTIYCDYNCLWDTTGASNVEIGYLQDWKTFSWWQDTKKHDANGFVSDPYFVDLANDDYALSDSSPCRTAGRGGAWPSYMGAIDPDAEETIIHRKRLGAGVWGKGRL